MPSRPVNTRHRGFFILSFFHREFSTFWYMLTFFLCPPVSRSACWNQYLLQFRSLSISHHNNQTGNNSAGAVCIVRWTASSAAFQYCISVPFSIPVCSHLTKRRTGGNDVITETNARNRQKKESRLGAGKRTRKHGGRAEVGDIPAKEAAE